MANIKPFNCYCVPDGPTYSGDGGGGGSGSGSGSGSSGYPTNTGCTRCTDLVTPVRMKLTWSPGSNCAGDWANAEYAGPFTCHWRGYFGTGTSAFCLWDTDELELETDTKTAVTRPRVGIGLNASGWYGTIYWRGSQEGATCTSTGTHADHSVTYAQSPTVTPPLNCLIPKTLAFSQFIGNLFTWYIGPNGLLYKALEPHPFPTSVDIEPAM